jgi:hypothetical protein
MGDEQDRNLQARIHGVTVLTAPARTPIAAILAPTGVQTKYDKLHMRESKMHIYIHHKLQELKQKCPMIT